jgi:predicted DCC family thiol-disulfide oxidoreductase YuxK
MKSEYKHLVFYDGQCGLCDHLVQFILSRDKKNLFAFAPLQGKTAKMELLNLPNEFKNEDSLVLIENYQTSNRKFYVLGSGALRVCWLIGGFWSVLGALSYLPSFLYNWCYRIVARNRHKFFKKDQCVIPLPNQRDRFLE